MFWFFFKQCSASFYGKDLFLPLVILIAFMFMYTTDIVTDWFLYKIGYCSNSLHKGLKFLTQK